MKRFVCMATLLAALITSSSVFATSGRMRLEHEGNWVTSTDPTATGRTQASMFFEVNFYDESLCEDVDGVGIYIYNTDLTTSDVDWAVFRRNQYGGVSSTYSVANYALYGIGQYNTSYFNNNDIEGFWSGYIQYDPISGDGYGYRYYFVCSDSNLF